MASSSSSFSASRALAVSRASARSVRPKVRCYHNEIAPLRIVRYHGPTEGKHFYGCSHWLRTCGYFKWADEVDQVTDLQFMVFERDTTIAELELQTETLEEKVKELMEEKLKLEEEAAKLEKKVDKKLMLALLFSWVFFSMVLLNK